MYNFLSPTQNKKFTEWCKTHPKRNTGAVGGRYTFHITPMSIGKVIIVTDDTDFSLDLDLTEDF